MECGVTNGGLWVDFTIFFWLAEFIKHPLEMWYSKTCKPYMNMGMNGHFEPMTRFEKHDLYFTNNITKKK
jgi:hypothetical protein